MNTKTQHIKIFKLNKAVVAVVFLFSAQIFLAQSIVSKFKKEIHSKRDAILELNAIYTDIIFKSWDKDKIFINAYIKGTQQNENELQELVDLWEVNINDNDSIVLITSDASRKAQRTVSTTAYNISEDISQQDMVRLLQNIVAPVLKNVQNNPIPEALKNSLNQLKFDYDAYSKLGKTYLKLWEYNLVKNLDDKSATEVRKWSKSATSNLQEVTSTHSQPTNNLSNTTKRSNYIQFSQTISTTASSMASKKVLEIFIPQNTKLRFKTRYGNVNVVNELSNAKAEMKYTPFHAEKVSGRETNLTISFAPVTINDWKEGRLSLGYVKKSKLNRVGDIDLYAKSSSVQIANLVGNGVIESLFGILDILKLDTKFSKIALISKNSDVGITLPKVAYNFAYTGNLSRIEIPKSAMHLTSLGDNYNQMLNGYSVSRNTDKEIQMSAVNSQVFLR